MHPYQLLLTVFVLLVASRVVNYVGKSRISNSLWKIYMSSSPDVTEIRTLKQEMHTTYKERTSISAQDEYAKWTKLNRKYEQLTKDIDNKERQFMEKSKKFTSLVERAMWMLLSLPIWYFRVMERKTSLFFFPPGLFPHSVEWVLAMPSAVKGSIGLGVWIFAVNMLLNVAEFVVKSLSAEKPAEPKVESKAEAAEPKVQAEKNSHAEPQAHTLD